MPIDWGKKSCHCEATSYTRLQEEDPEWAEARAVALSDEPINADGQLERRMAAITVMRDREIINLQEHCICP
ncbi:hypothetical protein SEA_NEFERTHENA_51 [Microbacterium phage Neferthena]|uniref:Uncharacterized protein n=1 Tax=Microbacterium phage Neferthena TaxID=2301539 RepID=A0A385D4I9_9CAUD|nr:hypothetical protein HOT92_gp51 [Microbacterium phage Neferthena]AXQ52914.1 hypothetical protein SEA_NEFERTHENA_51 [Microbacterium phage Neferthena]